MRHAPPKQTRAQLEARFKDWLINCRDKALDWPVESLARSYGMKEADVRASVAEQKKARGLC